MLTTRTCCLALIAATPIARAQQFLASAPPTLAVTVPTFDFFSRVGVGDFDGDLDLAGAGSYLIASQNILLVNKGNGTFASISPFGGNDLQVAVGDIDGDGDLDVFFGGSTRLLRNEGGMVFTNVTATQLPSSMRG